MRRQGQYDGKRSPMRSQAPSEQNQVVFEVVCTYNGAEPLQKSETCVDTRTFTAIDA